MQGNRLGYTLDRVVPWGRTYDEYVAMFALSTENLKEHIVGCGDGPASFNSVLTGRCGKVVSVDPLYRYRAQEIKDRIDEVYDEVMEQTRKNMDEFVWDHIPSIEELGRVRMSAMRDFLSDYPAGGEEGRYISASLPDLPFLPHSFDIALCSHFLFLYSDHLSVDFHVRSIIEMFRVANEARIFPLLELGSRTSRHLELVLSRLRSQGYRVEIEKVDYEFQKGGDEMMIVCP